MAVGLAPAAANAILDEHYDTDYPFIQLHVGDPGAAGTANTAGNATRKDTSAAWAPASGGSKTTDVDIDWTAGEVTTAEGYTHCSFWSASTAGNFGGSGTITANAVVASGDAFTLPAGAVTVSLAVATGDVITDDFSSQSAGTQLTDDPNWELLYDGGGGTPGRFDYRSGGGIEAVTAPGGAGRRLVARAETFDVDHYAEAVYTNDVAFTWVWVRGDSSGNAYYAFYGEDASQIYRLDAGVFTEIAAAFPTTTGGTVVRLEAEGSTIRMLENGVVRHSVTDTNHSTQTQIGVGTSSTGGQLDDFEGGPL